MTASSFRSTNLSNQVILTNWTLESAWCFFFAPFAAIFFTPWVSEAFFSLPGKCLVDYFFFQKKTSMSRPHTKCFDPYIMNIDMIKVTHTYEVSSALKSLDIIYLCCFWYRSFSLWGIFTYEFPDVIFVTFNLLCSVNEWAIGSFRITNINGNINTNVKISFSKSAQHD